MTILEHAPLKAYNTFGIDVSAAYFCRVRDKSTLLQLIKHNTHQYKDILILGGGSNLLLCANFDGLVIKNEIIGIEIIKEDKDHVWVRSLSGTSWQELVSYCVERNYGGIENLSLIPGTVGAAPMQNIGAYGVELRDVFLSLEAIDMETGEILIFDKDTCDFGYRQSIFKKEARGKYFIYSVTLKLSKHPTLQTSYGDIQKTLEENNITIANATLKDVANAVITIRKHKLPDPKEIGNAGSFYKNPELNKDAAEALIKQYPDMPYYLLPSGAIKIPAAWLIEQCGWKGKRVGNTGNHEQQALVIVNYKDATGDEILKHAMAVQQSVLKKFGILLEPEVNIIGLSASV
jgi:UDP-N-acetylmuramate dehydrogenase